MEKKNIILLIFIINIMSWANSHVFIAGPESLKKIFKERNGRDELYSNFANFGKIPYGYTLTGKLYYDIDNTEVEHGCKPLKTYNILSKSSIEAPTVMVDRGDCSFVLKSKHIQDIGGEVALVVNNDDVDPRLIFMDKDNTSTQKVHIPTILISKADGDIIKSFWKENVKNSIIPEIYISIKFEMKQVDGKDPEKIDIHFTSVEEKTYKFLIHFRRYYEELQPSLDVIPHYVTFPYYEKPDKNPVENCYYNGMYCLDAAPEYGVNDGRVIILENIRQKCIHLISYDKFGNMASQKTKYWDYMHYFFNDCMKATPPRFNIECSTEVMTKVKINDKEINNCIKESFGFENDPGDISTFIEKFHQNVKEDTGRENNILSTERYNNKNNLVFFPSVLINNQLFFGNLGSRNVLEAVCSGYKVIPKACYDENMKIPDQQTSNSYIYYIILLVVVLIAFNVLIYCLCRKYVKKKSEEKLLAIPDFDTQVNSIVANYFQLKEKNMSL